MFASSSCASRERFDTEYAEGVLVGPGLMVTCEDWRMSLKIGDVDRNKAKVNEQLKQFR